MTCAILHNFVIDEDSPEDFNDEIDDNASNTIRLMNGSPLGMTYLPTIPDMESFEEIVGRSVIQDAILDVVRINTYRRPFRNLERQQHELEEIAAAQAVPQINPDGIDQEYYHPQ